MTAFPFVKGTFYRRVMINKLEYRSLLIQQELAGFFLLKQENYRVKVAWILITLQKTNTKSGMLFQKAALLSSLVLLLMQFDP